MRSGWKKVSIICGVIGLCCIVAAGLFAFYNMYDDTRASTDLKAETELLEDIVLSPERTKEKQYSHHTETQQPTDEPFLIIPQTGDVPENSPQGQTPDPQQGQTPETTPAPTPEPTPVPESMPVITVDGWDYVAIISIPALDLEFCVRNEWSKEGGKKSPCRYTGSVYTNDLIICAHNYTSHFGRLKELQAGDQIILVDMNGEVYTYHAVYTEEIGRFDFDGMTNSGYDLSLFTCTIGGKARVTVRCTRDL